MKYLAILIFPLILILSYGGCGSSGSGDSVEPLNNCFSELSSNPCFDPNIGGTMTEVTNKSAEEVIDEQENSDDFIEDLEFDEVLRTRGRSIFLPDLPSDCRWEDSGLVIKNANDWDRYRNNCYFQDTFFDPPDVNFSQKMLLISLDGSAGFGTEIVAVLEFETELVAVVADTVPDAGSSEAKLFGSFIAEIPSKDLPVSFIRVEEICNTVFNFENVECLAESMLNSCEGLFCQHSSGRISLLKTNCEVLDCGNIECDDFGSNSGKIDMGILTDLETGNGTFADGHILTDEGEIPFSCTILIE